MRTVETFGPEKVVTKSRPQRIYFVGFKIVLKRIHRVPERNAFVGEFAEMPFELFVRLREHMDCVLR